MGDLPIFPDVMAIVDIDGNRFLVTCKVDRRIVNDRTYYDGTITIKDPDNKTNKMYFNKMEKDYAIFLGILYSIRSKQDINLFVPVQINKFKRLSIRVVKKETTINISMKKESIYENNVTTNSLNISLPLNQIIVLITALNSAVNSINTVIDYSMLSSN